ncbi:amylo-alpha-1,6-glucosidase [Planctomicrobium sp. SH661]|uniref:amylo-alpha-1,6-glucosidase n=1 Tax=Planctomicrobium sp. SH661 TaxID=3448124 RepID=UPI003F5C9C42
MMKQTDREWLETDGLGGFASGTISGRRTRRYHALLLAASPADNSRFVLVNGMEVQVQTAAGISALSSQRYLPNVIHPHGDRLIQGFQAGPWPTWDYALEDGTKIRQEIFVPRDSSAVVIRWSLLEARHDPVQLMVRPLISGRDYHSLHLENGAFEFQHTGDSQRLVWSPYQGVPQIVALSNGAYTMEPLWFRRFFYTAEAERGLDDCEDLASPGTFRFDLNHSPAVLIFTASGERTLQTEANESVEQLVSRLERIERVRRLKFPSRLHRSADQFIVRSGPRKTIIAGYPWFTDWGRDTFISLRGLCLATERYEDAGRILRDWAGTISEGMLPNRFPDGKSQPEYNSVDASLWYIIAVQDYLNTLEKNGQTLQIDERNQLRRAVISILVGYQQGTRFQIRADSDGLLAAGVSGVQLTWMDAKVGDWIVTPRIGKPVEIQALWINALQFASQFDPSWRELLNQAKASFQRRFWNPERQCLFDVVDVDHQPGRVDASIRPNQIFAVGGLPLSLLEPDQAKSVVNTVEKLLLTPLGLRTLEPADPAYQPHYTGNVRARDGAYHQGTVWPWLMGPFVEAWLRVHGETDGNKTVARARFVQPLLNHLDEAGLGHVSEIADGEPTQQATGSRQIPRGCPFQAWSLGELLRILETMLATD